MIRTGWLLASVLCLAAMPAAAMPEDTLVDALPKVISAAAADPVAVPISTPAMPTEEIDSLFYSPEEVADIRLAINTYLKHIGRGGDPNFDEDEFLQRLGRLKKVSTGSRFYTYPQFYLSSIVYHAADDWVIWINGDKITQATSPEHSDVHVTRITADEVDFEWLPPAMDKVTQVWRQYPNDEVKVDLLRGKVWFTLKPNQTFSSYVMRIVEGKVTPVAVDNAKLNDALLAAEKAAADAQKKKEEEEKILPEESKNPEPVPVAPPPSSEQPKRKEGLGGLIDSYKSIQAQ